MTYLFETWFKKLETLMVTVWSSIPKFIANKT